MKRIIHIIVKAVMWTAIGIVGLVALVVLLLYLPPVQDFAVRKALIAINNDQMRISVGKFRLSPPLRLDIDSLNVDMPGIGISAANANAHISLLPLLKLDVDASQLAVEDVHVAIGTPDSALYMLADLRHAAVVDAQVGLVTSKIDITRFEASDGNISLVMTPDTVPPPAKENTPIDWRIALRDATLRRIVYSMQMLPTIDTLGCTLPYGHITDADVDLATNRISVGNLLIDSVDATYLTPSAEYLATHSVAQTPTPTDTVTSQPWLVTVDQIGLHNSHGLYAAAGILPTSEQFDPSYIEVSEINIDIDSLRNRGAEIRVPLRHLSGRERCGIPLSASGLFEMDSTALAARNFVIATLVSDIHLDASMGLTPDNPALNAALSASIGPDDLRRLMPAGTQQIADMLPTGVPITAEANIDGHLQDLHIHRLGMAMPGVLQLDAHGDIAQWNDLNRAQGNIKIAGALTNGRIIEHQLPQSKDMPIHVPKLRISGDVSLLCGTIDGTLKALTPGGDMALDARWNNRSQGYDVELNLDSFPIQNILPRSGAADITATLGASGEGIDFNNPRLSTDITIDLKQAIYQGYSYRNITLDAIVADGHASLKAQSSNPGLRFTVDGNGNITGPEYRWNLDANVRSIDLRMLGLSDTVADGSVHLTGNASFRPGTAPTRRNPGSLTRIQADLNVADLYWHMPTDAINASNINIYFACDSTTQAKLTDHDLVIDFNSPQPLDTLLNRFADTSQLIASCIASRRINVDSLHSTLPILDLQLRAGTNNIITNYMMGHDMGFKSLYFSACNDSLLSADATLIGFNTGETRTDTIALAMRQSGRYLLYDLQMHNRPGTFDQFAQAQMKGYLNEDRLSILVNQHNLEGETGYSIGAMATMADSATVHLNFVPYHPIIGYKEWEVNRDNFVEFNTSTMHLDANLYLHNPESSLHLYTEHSDSNEKAQEDINLDITDIKIADWIAINPFAPPIAGDLSAKLRVSYDKPDLNGIGTVTLANFSYGKQKVGTFDLGLNVATNTSGTIRANANLAIDGNRVINAYGNLNDTTAVNPFMLDFELIRFPLAIANPFLPQGTAKLSGVLNGAMDVVGSLTDPKFNGYVRFDSAAVDVTMLGTRFAFSPVEIPVDSNVVRFNNFAITGANANPLTINGTIDMQSLTMPRIDLAMKARNMQLVGSKKSRRNEVYGKVFANIDASAKGSLRFLNVNADLNVLEGTNVTYVLQSSVSELASRSNQDLVKFVNFADTTEVMRADTTQFSPFNLNLNALLTISTGSIINVDLDAGGKNKVSIQPSGTVNYISNFTETNRLTGRINIDKGFVRYTPPALSEKLFNFEEGSYVSFTGEMMNPTLNIHAYDEIRANVSQSGANSRLVNFDVSLGVTGTLETMNIAFDLSCPDDITVANELASMTPEQRANQAMNLLLYGMYSAGGTSTISSGSIGQNALYGFIEGQLNALAAQAVKGVDISFGIKQYDVSNSAGVGSTAMSYSYRVSKSLFDDRFKIVVGGNYTTDAEADENFAQNLIADISFEYFLNKAGTMYVRLFRHTGYESILEGEIVQTGVGFVYKRKIGRIADMFHFLQRRDPEPAIASPSVTNPQTGSHETPQK